MCFFVCPVCGKRMEIRGKSYFCPLGHCYDIAKSGYVNLLPSSGAQERHGDDKAMVKARTALLDRGFYDPLSRRVSELAAGYLPRSGVILDAGCGEGKYSADVLSALKAAGKEASLIGIDISKDALTAASKRSGELILAAASSARLPVENSSCDIVLNIFSPFMKAEFLRVLRPGGRLIRVIPLERHLWELKELIYDRPYENDPIPLEESGLHIVEKEELRYNISLCGHEIMDLFMMTPYYYKTGRDDQQKAAEAKTLETRLEFGIVVYEKE